MRKLIVAAVAALMSTSAIAADKGAPVDLVPAMPAVASNTSCYVQALAGSAVSTVGSDVLPESLSASGWTIGAGVGCDVKFHRVVLGALARIELPIDSSGTLIDADKSWMAAGRIGYMVNTGLMAYGLLGYERQDFSLAGIDLGKDGMVVGGGLEVMISRHLSLTAEYTNTLIKSTDIGGFEFRPDSHKARVGLSYRFNSLFGE